MEINSLLLVEDLCSERLNGEEKKGQAFASVLFSVRAHFEALLTASIQFS